MTNVGPGGEGPLPESEATVGPALSLWASKMLRNPRKLNPSRTIWWA